MSSPTRKLDPRSRVLRSRVRFISELHDAAKIAEKRDPREISRGREKK